MKWCKNEKKCMKFVVKQNHDDDNNKIIIMQKQLFKTVC